MREKKRILWYVFDNVSSKSRIGVLLIPLERCRQGLQLLCFKLCDIPHGLAKEFICVIMGMRNLEKHIFRDAL